MGIENLNLADHGPFMGLIALLFGVLGWMIKSNMDHQKQLHKDHREERREWRESDEKKHELLRQSIEKLADKL